MKTTGRTRTWLRATVLWSVLSVAVALLGADRALAAAMEVDARSVHRAVWKVYGGGKSGTAFAIGERHFLTCAHVIKGFADHEATEVFINRHGSEDSRRLRVNYGHVAVAVAQDIALFTTRETVDHYFTLAETSATEGETGLRAMGHPLGLPMETLRQTDPITYQNDFHLEIPADRITRGGLSGSPVFRDYGKVVGMHCQGSDNMSVAVKVEHLRRFIDGDLPWTACRDHPSVAACVERATTQTRELAEAGDLVAQYQLGRDDGYLDKDVAMLRRAAEGGFAPAQAALGRWLRERKQWAECRPGGTSEAPSRATRVPVTAWDWPTTEDAGWRGTARGPSNSCSSRPGVDMSLPSMAWACRTQMGTERNEIRQSRDDGYNGLRRDDQDETRTTIRVRREAAAWNGGRA